MNHNPNTLHSEGGDTVEVSSSSGSPNSNTPNLQGSGFRQGFRKMPWWVWWLRLVPFVLSAMFFVSGFLSIFAPLPILLVRAKSGRRLAVFAVLTNSFFVFASVGDLRFLGYWVFAAVPGLLIPELFYRRMTLERTVVATLMAMAAALGLCLLGYWQITHANPLALIQEQLGRTVDELVRVLPAGSGVSSPADVEELKRLVRLEFPSWFAIMCLVLVSSNALLLFKTNPIEFAKKMGMDSNFLKKWKAPEFLVWPTIAAGFFFVFPFGGVSDIAINVFRFLLAIYAFQGLSILSFLFDVWGVRREFRFIGYTISIALMLPLVLSLGFFDLWFDFRAKFRQS